MIEISRVKKKFRKILYSTNSMLIHVEILFHKRKKKRETFLRRFTKNSAEISMEINFFFPLARNESNHKLVDDGYARSNNQSSARFSNEIQLSEAIEFRVEEITVIFLMRGGTDAIS